jgi:hypothetical protein
MVDRFTFINADNDKLVDKAINNVVKTYSSKAAREDLHVALVACVEHALKHNDASKLTNLTERLPNNAPHKNIKLWVYTYTSLRYVKDKGGASKYLPRNEKGEKVAFTFDKEGRDVTFYEVTKANDDKNATWSPLTAVDAFIKRMNSQADKAENEYADQQRAAMKDFAQRLSILERDILEPAFKMPMADAIAGEVDFENKPERRASVRH